INTAEWARWATTTQIKTAYAAAWNKAVDLHMQLVTACPSSIAYGDIMGDGWSNAQSIATTKGAANGSRLYHLTTDLNVSPAPPYNASPPPGGSYANWAGGVADQTIKN